MTQAFQLNYNLPWTINQTVRPPYLPYGRAFDAVTGLDTSLLQMMFLPTQLLLDNSAPSSNATSSLSFKSLDNGNEPVRTARRQPRSVKSVKQPEQMSAGSGYDGKLLNVGKFDENENRNKVDMSAGELYQTFEQSLQE